MKTRIYLCALLLAALLSIVLQWNTDAPNVYAPIHSKIDINQAGEDAFSPLFGEEIAQSIVLFREENGAFPSVDALRNVPGISLSMLDSVRDALKEP